jgi:hypothetical protein
LHRLRPVLERRQYGFRVREECTPGFGEHRPTSPSFEQGHPQLIFKKLDAPRNRRLRPAELASRPRHPAKLGNRDESLQFMQVHSVISKADVRSQNYALDVGKIASQMTACWLNERAEVSD